MKVIVLGTRGFPDVQGGVETHCENLYPLLVKLGCDVVVLARSPYVPEYEQNFQGVRLIPLKCPKSKYIEAIYHTAKGILAAKRMGCDLLHIHAIGPALMIPFARLLGIKVVMTNHGPDYDRKKWNGLAKLVLKSGEYLGSKFANEVINISETIRIYTKEKFHREAVLIPNGVKIPQVVCDEQSSESYQLNQKKYLFSAGRFVPEKGFHDLIAAFNGVCADKELSDWKLVIAGAADHEDQYSRNLKELAAENDRIVLPGFLKGEALQALFSQAGLFILPSYHEGLPIALLEAMSYGLPCIVSDIPANLEVPLEQDRYFPVGNEKALQEKLRYFMNRPFSSDEKDRQIEKIKQLYNWDEIATSTMKVYRKVVS